MWGSGEDGSIRDECVRTSYVVMRCACGLRLSHWRLLGFSVCGRCVARTREAHLDARARIYMSVLPVARLLSLRAVGLLAVAAVRSSLSAAQRAGMGSPGTDRRTNSVPSWPVPRVVFINLIICRTQHNKKNIITLL